MMTTIAALAAVVNHLVVALLLVQVRRLAAQAAAVDMIKIRT